MFAEVTPSQGKQTFSTSVWLGEKAGFFGLILVWFSG